MKKKLLIVLPFVVVALFVMGLVMLLGTNSDGVNTTVVHADAPSGTSNYLYLENTGDAATIKLNKTSISNEHLPVIQYSFTGTDSWSTLSYGTNIAIPAGGKIYFSGEYVKYASADLGATSYAFGSKSGYLKFALVGTAARTFTLGGDVTTLLTDAGNVTDLRIYGKDVFYNLFYDMGSITKLASDFVMPSTTLSIECYRLMFARTGLEETPANLLPATEMQELCYNKMFYDCANLKKAPDLPAYELANKCYQEMFGLCKNLELLRVNFKKWEDTATANYSMLPSITGRTNQENFTFVCPTGLDITNTGYVPADLSEILTVYTLIETRTLTKAPTFRNDDVADGTYKVEKAYVDGEKNTIKVFCVDEIAVNFADWYLSTSLQYSVDGNVVKLRFIGLVNNLEDYSTAGFYVTIGKNEYTLASKFACETFLADGTMITITDAGMTSGYFFVREMDTTANVTKDTVLTVKPFVETVGGVTKDGAAVTLNLSNIVIVAE